MNERYCWILFHFDYDNGWNFLYDNIFIGDKMTKNQKENKYLDILAYSVVSLMFVSLIGQIIGLHCNMSLASTTFEYLFGVFAGAGLGIYLTVRVMQ